MALMDRVNEKLLKMNPFEFMNLPGIARAQSPGCAPA
jgi:hypothetical protein